MNRRRLLFIGVAALAVGSLVSLKIYRMLRAQSGPAKDLVDVLVAAHDIPVGAKIEDRDLKVAKLPSEDLAPDVFHIKSRAVGHGVVLPIEMGDLVLPYKLAEDGGSIPSSLIPTGMRAVSVNVNEVTGVAGFVAPGTRVDVLATVNLNGSNEPHNVTILQNVKVLASDQHLDRGGSVGPAHVVTLLTLPEDAQKLALALLEGHIQLILRNPVDMKQEMPSPIGNENLYGTRTPAQPRVPRVKRTLQPVRELPKFYEIESLGGLQRETIKLKQ